LGRNEILIQWNPPEQPLGRINYYEVTQDGEVIYSGIERTCTSRRLQPNTEYTFKVAAWTNEGKCESEPAKKKTTRNIKSNFPREPLYPFEKIAKIVKAKKERSLSNGDSPHSLQQRVKSVPYVRSSRTIHDAYVRPRTSTEGERNPPKLLFRTASSKQGSIASTNATENMHRSATRRRHFSTGTMANMTGASGKSTSTIRQNEQTSEKQPFAMRHSVDRPTIISLPPTFTKDSLIGLNFQPGSYNAYARQPLKTSYSCNDKPTATGGQDGTKPREKRSVSFGTPFSRALDELQTIHNNNSNRYSSSDYPPNTGFPWNKISPGPSRGPFSKI